VDVVGEDAEGVENEAVSVGSDGEEIAEGGVDGGRGPEEEPALGAAT
jgi:hypothetical protein